MNNEPISNQNHSFLSLENKYFTHLIKHQLLYLLLLAIIVLSIPLLSNLIQDQPVLMGLESYYHLSNAQDLSSKNFYYTPLKLFSTYLPEGALTLYSIILGLLIIYLLQRLLPRLNFSPAHTFLILVLFILSPVFIYTFITLSNFGLFFFLLISGLLLSLSPKRWIKYCSIIPLILTTFFDFLTSLFVLIVLLMWILYTTEKASRGQKYVLLACLTALAIINFLLLEVPLYTFTFAPNGILVNLLSDLGALSGLSLFIIPLAIIGLAANWKNKSYHYLFLLLSYSLLAYALSSTYLFLVGIWLIFFSALGVFSLLQKEWKLPLLKSFTILIIGLGILFSIASYQMRISELGPTDSEVNALTWINENVPPDSRILSDAHSSYYLHYFANQNPLYFPHHYSQDYSKIELTRQIYTSAYPTTTLPLLQENNIALIYISPYAKQNYPAEGSLLSVLKNERFKMVHSSEEAEVWAFN